ncbi:MAG TPA: bifunctional oligoribonuclease/PAP phosphatase NrnA [Gemmatimonadaceae bacterium]|nr:bifunctional oligoribonuclease/PAP phosphatase NrnA [Gemmatimonadaceae bacterium]
MTTNQSPLLQNQDYLGISDSRRAAIERIAAEVVPGRRVALSTHMNADGDGCGSEAALARLLVQRGLDVRIVNPTPWPDLFGFLLGDDVKDETSKGAAALQGIDALIVLDISDVRRLGSLAESVRRLQVPKMVIDHHIASEDPAGDILFTDVSACATGELVYDFASALGWELTPAIAQALYAAILTDTGSFRFSNTSPRCHAIAAELLATGVDPEDMYVRIYASAPAGRVRLLADVLSTLGVDDKRGLSWLSMTNGALEKYAVRQEDLDGIVEHARSIAGTRMALFFRDLGYGKVKVSFRSTGEVDVNAFARQFGGGGHAKASGALITGSLEEVRERVIAAAQTFLEAGAASHTTR